MSDSLPVRPSTGAGQTLPRRTATFVIRLWAEYLEQAPPAWRGEIEHVDSGRRVRFRKVTDMVRFIAAHASETAAKRKESGE